MRRVPIRRVREAKATPMVWEVRGGTVGWSRLGEMGKGVGQRTFRFEEAVQEAGSVGRKGLAGLIETGGARDRGWGGQRRREGGGRTCRFH